jgi:hypothetical protein
MPATRGMKNGIGGSRRDARHRDLGETFDVRGVQQGIGLVDEVNLDGAYIRIHRHGVFREIGIQEAAEAVRPRNQRPPMRGYRIFQR